MESNMKLKITTPAALSAKEVKLIARLEYEGKDVYTREGITSYCVGEQNTDYLIRKLLKKDRLKSIVKNTYLYVPMKAPDGAWSGNEYLMAKALARGGRYYIGYSNIFYSYGFTDQVAQMVHVINEKYSICKTLFGVRYQLVKVLPDRLYGWERRKIKNEDVCFATRERALIDVFEFYDGKRARDILRDQLWKIDLATFVDFVARYPVQKVRRRIGYCLEALDVREKLLSKINAGVKGYSPLYDTGSNKGKINNAWRVIING